MLLTIALYPFCGRLNDDTFKIALIILPSVTTMGLIVSHILGNIDKSDKF